MKKLKKISHREFLESFKNVPRVAVSLIVKNEKDRVLLAKRNIPPGKNEWHLPGSFLIKNEKLNDLVRRILKKELGYSGEIQRTVASGVFEDIDKDPRGHVVDIIYQVEIKDMDFKPNEETKEARFFERLPEKIGFNHGEILKELGFK